MAKLKSFIKLEGTLDGLTFYKSKDGYLVKTKGGVSKSRIMNDPAFERTRENLSEFGLNATTGKLIRQSIGPMLHKGKDSRLSSRMLKVMSSLKNLDTVSIRGKRQAGLGLQSPAGKELLKGFNFNNEAHLDRVLQTSYTLDTTTGILAILNLNPLEQLDFPEGTSHVRFSNSVTKLDFETNTFQYAYSESLIFPISNSVENVQLTPSEVPVMEGVQFHLLLIEFLQEVNSEFYPLFNGDYNVLTIIDVI